MTQDSFITTTTSSLERLGMCGSTLIVAVSGGVDSITLVHTLHKLKEDAALTLIVAHANHKLRGVEGDDDERFVVSVSDGLGLACVTGQLDVSEHASTSGKGIEEAARYLRYNFLCNVARQHGASIVATAHTLDDNAETMLMHLARGSGTRGLSGIAQERLLAQDVRVVRPFLHESRKNVKEMALVWGLQWREDSSNTNDQFLRNNVRSTVMPSLRKVFGPSVAERMLRSAILMGEADEILQGIINELLPHVVINHDPLRTDLLVSVLHNHSSGLVRAVIRSAIPCTHEDVNRVYDLLNSETGSRASLSKHRQALRERDVITVLSTVPSGLLQPVVIDRDGTYVAGTYHLTVEHSASHDVIPQTSHNVAYINTASLQGSLVWREWQNGDRFQPFGFDGTMLVSDLLTNIRIPHAHRRDVRVVCDDLGIIWVCGVRSAERSRVTATTQEILILSQTT